MFMVTHRLIISCRRLLAQVLDMTGQHQHFPKDGGGGKVGLLHEDFLVILDMVCSYLADEITQAMRDSLIRADIGNCI